MKRSRQEAERTLSSIEPRRISSRISPNYVAHSLIEDSVYRCKGSDVVTRITVSLTRPQIDTDDRPSAKSRLSDGVLFITTTGIEEQDIRSYSIHESGAGGKQGKTNGCRISSTESKPKTANTFSGTEASVLLIGDTNDLEIYTRNLCRKISILKIKGVLIEFCLEESRQQNSNYDQHEENCELISDAGVELPDSLSDLDRLGIGMIDYTSKYIYKYQESSSEKQLLKQALKVGKGQSVHNALWKMQACFVLIQKNREEPERIVTGTDESIGTFETQVLSFEDFQYRPVRPESYTLRAIYRVDWSTFGLAIKRIDNRPCAGLPSLVIVWDRPAGQIERFDLVLHRFRDFPDQKPTWKGQMKMTKSAIEAALQDLKETLPHLLSNRQDVEVQKHIPALARCISGLVTSSTNADFRTECADIIGLSTEDEGGMEQFLSSKLLEILVQRTRRGLQSAAMTEQKDEQDRSVPLAHSRQAQEEDGEETNSSWIWDFW